MKKLTVGACLLLTSVGIASPALAIPTSETYSLDTYVGSGSAAAGPYGTVTLNQVGSNVLVNVTLESPTVGFVDTGAGQALLFDLIDPSITVTGLSAGYSFDSLISGNIHADGSGYWDYAVSCAGGACGHGGSSPAPGPLSFTLDDVTLADFMQNTNGNYFASDLCIGVARHGCGVTGDAVATTGVTTNVPEPSTLALFGAGLLLLGAFARRRARIDLEAA